MFNRWSIKSLLKLWSVITAVVILLMAVVVIYFLQIISDLENGSQAVNMWLFLLFAFALFMLISQVISTISSKLSYMAATLRNAMHELSCQHFDTRLDDKSSNIEFAFIARDFNQFAGVTENLISDLASAKESLQEREHYLTTILNTVMEAIIVIHASGKIETCNSYTSKLLNTSEDNLNGETIFRFFQQQHQIGSLDNLLKQAAVSKEFEGVDYHNQPFSMSLSISALTGDADLRYVCVVTDISVWKQTQQQLITASSELDTILENAMVGIAFIKDRLLLRVNQKFEEIFAYSKDEIIGNSTRYLCPDNETFVQLGMQAYGKLENGDTFEGVMQLSRKNGELFWCALSSKAISPERPQEGTIWLFEDVTIQRENDEKLIELASIDSLTGLVNRSVFNDRLVHAIHKSHRNDGRLAVFFLDLDHFKNINDSLGHKAGDQLLCEVAKRLTGCIREEDTVARLGGDEFTVILEDIVSVQYVARVAEKIADTILKPYKLDMAEVSISSSVGISLYPADGRDSEILIRNADAAMYHAKNNGRNNFQFYSAEMNAQIAQRLVMENELRKAVEQDDFYLHFQPQFDIINQQIVGTEVLLRWHHEQWGDVSPAEFIPILEDTGLIVPIGEQVLKNACKSYMSLRDKLIPEFKVAVNLSGRQFQGTPLSNYVQQVLDETGMSPRNLELEITESILVKDTDLAITTLNELKRLGVTLAIDDFGTGYSSLSYLKKFPLDVLKIDKTFINDVTLDKDGDAIVDAILAMSKHLGLDVVAEGIETVEQLTFLQTRHCHRGQGFYFSRPVDFQNLSRLIDEQVIVNLA